MNLITIPQITDEQYNLFCILIKKNIGVHLNESKKPLVQNRLQTRLRKLNMVSWKKYYDYIKNDADEFSIMINQVTTNETHFFREREQFHVLTNKVPSLHDKSNTFRVWSAASSTGEEAHSLAMVLSDHRGEFAFEIIASDVNEDVIQIGRAGIYDLKSSAEIPVYYLKKYCLKGKNQMQGKFTFIPQITSKITFMKINLNERIPEIGLFDCVFLKNVFIYFTKEKQNEIIDRIFPIVKPSGFIFIGLSESLLHPGLKRVDSSVYQKI